MLFEKRKEGRYPKRIELLILRVLMDGGWHSVDSLQDLIFKIKCYKTDKRLTEILTELRLFDIIQHKRVLGEHSGNSWSKKLSVKMVKLNYKSKKGEK